MVKLKVRRSGWTAWDNRRSLEARNKPGVYLLAHFPGQPPSRVDPLSANIVYIGETCKNSLQGRWNQFRRSVEGKFGHSGGRTYKKRFGKMKLKDLFVATIYTGEREEVIRSSFIKYEERRLLWGFVRKHKRLPCCNLQ